MNNKEINALKDTAISIMDQHPEHSYKLLKIISLHRPERPFIQKQLQKAKQRLIKEMPFKGQIISARTDGLLARINCIFNGVILAEYYGVPFIFTWASNAGVNSNVHSCVDGRKPDFIAWFFLYTHYVPESKLRRCSLPWQKKANLSILRGEVVDTLVSKEIFFQNLEESKNLLSAHILKREHDSEKLKTYSDIFERFFSRSIKKQFKKLIQKRNWSEAVAIHYRGGDVIYGSCRFGRNVRHRSLSLPIVESIIQDNSDKAIILFGTPFEETLKELIYIKQKYPNVELSVDIIGDDISHNSDTTLYDAFLMSACKTLYCAGKSNMTIFANNISNVEIVIPSATYQQNVLNSTLKSSVFLQYSAQQRAFIYYNLFYLYMKDMKSSYEELDSYLVKVYELDPENTPVLLLRYLYLKKNNQKDLINELEATLTAKDYDLEFNSNKLPEGVLKKLNYDDFYASYRQNSH